MMEKFLKVFLLSFVTAALTVSSVIAQTAAPEYKQKAAFLYKFLTFVEWPPQTFPEDDSPYVIGVLGEDPFFDPSALVNYLDEAIDGKTINNRKLIVRKSERSIANLKNCHLLFINKSERKRLKSILTMARENNILTVSETDNFCEQGGIVNFRERGDKVRFEVNLEAAEQANLKVSSKLLNVAKIIATEAR